MSHRVIFSPEAQDQLIELFDYVARAASPDTAARYTQAVVSCCESLCTFPLRGTRRDDVRPGLRVTNYRKRTVVAFEVDATTVSILGIFYGGRDYESVFQSHPDCDRE